MLTRDPLQHINRGRLFSLSLLVCVAAGVLLSALYGLQIQQGAAYTEKARSLSTVSIVLPPARGIIYDRNGKALAENRANIDIDVYLRELIGHYRRSQKKLPMTEVGKSKRIDVEKILNNSAGDVFALLNIKPTFTREKIMKHYWESPNVPFTLVRNLDFTTLSIFSERNPNIPGIEATARPTRYYPYGALACHILGYVGHAELKTDAQYTPDVMGKDGIERSFDETLQGQPGARVLKRNQVGLILGEDNRVNPRSGQFIYLTIDSRIQYIVERVMQRVGRGACVVMNPNNGDILAMASVPNFDPNIFVPQIDAKEWKQLTTDTTRPLFNRAMGGYAAGSVFKPVVALAALDNEKLEPRFTSHTIIDSPGAIFRANRWWNDWSPNGQGAIPLKVGLAMSCNTFFWQVAERTGIDSIVEMAKRVGFGERLLNHKGDGDTEEKTYLWGEDSGVMPSPEWMSAIGRRKIEAWKKKMAETGKKTPIPLVERWSLGHTLNTAIGQGYVEVTPLQIVTMTSSIANGGTVYYPRLLLGETKEVEDPETGLVKNEPQKEFPIVARARLASPEAIAAVKEGMRAVVEEGTGKRAAIPGYTVAGKTGTAQFWSTIHGRRVKDNRTWFTGFTPIDGPRYAIVVMVEGGVSGGGTCAPLVHDILAGIYEMEAAEARNEPFQMTYLTPTIGNFGGVQEVPSETVIPATPADAADQPTGSVDENAEDANISRTPPTSIYRNARGLRR